MRRISASSTPRHGEGFSFLERVALIGLVALTLAASAPANAAITVKLRLSAGTVHAPLIKECSVSTGSGASGIGVLLAAKQQGCIASFSFVFVPGLGSKVTCIDPGPTTTAGLTRLCEQEEGLVSFWAYYKNSVAQERSVDTFNASAGDTLGLVYTSWLTCFATYPTCVL